MPLLSVELQTTKQIFTIELTYSDFPCHLKVNRDENALISRRWKCKKGKQLTITAGSVTKIEQYEKFIRAVFRALLVKK